ncbi:uncharacterized protein LOC123672182 isoform X2 [Harmonia axyridis]|uniref:uncharacterized protein LOC123672182 isoform X2 n=1 Tax=Harmonia axyridis TaxID=115357 RepID=UPI001E2794B9|nr:uncharacterized protein LOC123672182 isoform X2 [Harmonia axyridis]
MGILGPIVWFQYVVFCYILQYILSMMSNHSPNSHREMFELKETNTTPASTSKECDRGDNLLKGSAIVDATDSVPMNSAYYAMNNASNIKYIDGTLPCINDKVPLAENEDLPNSSGTSVEPKDTSKQSDETNKPDEVEPENEEDLCLKCVYVSVKCCECTIM